jgi:hypothetical protein
MKKLVSGIIIGALLVSCMTVFATNFKVVSNNLPIFVDGEQKQVTGYNIDGNTCLDLKDMAKVFNVSVKYNKDNKSIEINSNNSILTDKKIDGLNIYQNNNEEYVNFEDAFNLLSIKNHRDICLTYCENYQNPRPNQAVKVENFDIFLNILNNDKINKTIFIVGNIPCTYLQVNSNSFLKCISLNDYNQYIKPLLPKNIMEIKSQHEN